MDVLSEAAELRVGAMVTVPNTRAKARRPEIMMRVSDRFIGYPLSSILDSCPSIIRFNG
jgi:hypothetical protein